MMTALLVLFDDVLHEDGAKVTSQRSQYGRYNKVFLRNSFNEDIGLKGFGGRVGFYINTADIDRIYGFQEKIADDAVPVGLRVFGVGMAVAEQLWGNGLVRVVHLDCQLVWPWFQKLREVVNLFCGDVIAVSHQFTIHENCCSFCALHMEEYAFLIP